MDVLKDEPDSRSEASVMLTHDDSQVCHVKIEVTDVKEEDGPEVVTFPVTEAEHDVSPRYTANVTVTRCRIDACITTICKSDVRYAFTSYDFV